MKDCKSYSTKDLYTMRQLVVWSIGLALALVVIFLTLGMWLVSVVRGLIS